jgi:anti-sigma B factor antagonist
MNPFARATVAYELRHWSAGVGRPHVLCASGELDLQAAPELRELLCRLSDLGTRHFVVDLTTATFMDSTAIGVLNGRQRRLHLDGGSLVLVCTNEFLLRTLEIAGMGRVFEIHQTLGGALASFAGVA